MSDRARLIAALPFLVFTITTLSGQAPHGVNPTTSWIDPYREPASRLIGEAVSTTFAWQRLAVLTDSIGHRLSGSPALDRAIQWAAEEMKRDGLENVHTERVMVPKWVRGSERAEVVEPARHSMAMLGLGNSVGTPAEGVQAPVVMVHSFEELDANPSAVRGRIVCFNAPFTNYGETVRFRSAGPSRRSS
jgi:carboxypeptidase Q